MTKEFLVETVDQYVDQAAGIGSWFFDHLGVTALILTLIVGTYFIIKSRKKKVATTGARLVPLRTQVMSFLRFTYKEDSRPLLAKAPWLTIPHLALATTIIFIASIFIGPYDRFTVLPLVLVLVWGYQRQRPIRADRDRAVEQMWDIANTAFRFPKGAELNKRGYVIVRQWHKLVTPKQVIVMFRASSNASDPAKQQSFEEHFNGMAMAGTAWDYQWEPENNRVIITAEPPLPSTAPLPFPTIVDYEWDAFPLGIGVGGVPINWEPAKVPHCIVAGKSGSGKSVLQRNILIHALQSPNWKLILIDPKRVELSMYKNGANVLTYAVDDESMTEALEFALKQMKDRYELMENLGVAHYSRLPETPHALLVMVDEATSLMKGTGDKEIDELKQRNKSIVGTIAREGRAAGVHLVLATQRPDADVLGGDTRSTIEARVAMGGLDDTASRMILGNSMATTTPSQPRGRGVFGDGASFSRFQSFYLDESEVGPAVDLSARFINGSLDPQTVADKVRAKPAAASQKTKVSLGFMDKVQNAARKVYPSDEEIDARKAAKKTKKKTKKAQPTPSTRKTKKTKKTASTEKTFVYGQTPEKTFEELLED